MTMKRSRVCSSFLGASVLLFLLLPLVSWAFSPSQVNLLTRDGTIPAPPVLPTPSGIRPFRYDYYSGPWDRSGWDYSPYYRNYGRYSPRFHTVRETGPYAYDRYGKGLGGYGYGGLSGNSHGAGMFGSNYYNPHGGGFGGSSYYGGGRGYYPSYGGGGMYGSYYPYGGAYRDGYGYNNLWMGRDMYRFPIGPYSGGGGYPYSYYGGGGGYYGGYGYGGGYPWFDSSGWGPSYFGYGSNGLGGTSSNNQYMGRNWFGGSYYGGGGGYYGAPFYGGVGYGSPFYNQQGGMMFY